MLFSAYIPRTPIHPSNFVQPDVTNTAGMTDFQGEDDQRGMDLGHEYHDNDGGGGMDQQGPSDVIEGEVLGLPSPDSVTPTDEELDDAWESGYQSAADGKPESDCPVMKGAMCIAWVKGWKAWHEQNPADDASNDEKKAA
jgi:ribosome modulation factor